LFLFSFFSINKMFDSKFIATLFAVAISVIAICNINTNRITSNEGFGFGGLPSTETRKEYFAANSMQDYFDGNTYSVPRGVVEGLKDKNKTMQDYAERTYNSSGLGQQAPVERFTNESEPAFFSTSNFQSNLSPRGVEPFVGPYARESYVRYDQPSRENMAVPTNPLGYANCVEGFVEPYISQNSLMKPNYSEGNYNSLAGGDLMVTSDLFPVQNMSALNGVDKNGQPTQCVFFERIIHSNRNNRRRSQGDPIRGDLPIVPINNGWFNTSASPIDDLQQGAMNVIGGMGSESSKRFAEFIKESGGRTTVAGVDTELTTNQSMNTVQALRR
jgi:hypothetical protein